MKKYKKYVVGKITRDSKGEESLVYFPAPVEESFYAEENNLDMTKLASVFRSCIKNFCKHRGR